MTINLERKEDSFVNIILLPSFSRNPLLKIFHWSDSKSTQVSRTLQSILADIDTTVVGIILILPIINIIYSFQVFYTPALANNFSLESEWQQVFKSPEQQVLKSPGIISVFCLILTSSSLDGFQLSSYFQVLQFFY